MGRLKSAHFFSHTYHKMFNMNDDSFKSNLQLFLFIIFVFGVPLTLFVSGSFAFYDKNTMNYNYEVKDWQIQLGKTVFYWSLSIIGTVVGLIIFFFLGRSLLIGFQNSKNWNEIRKGNAAMQPERIKELNNLTNKLEALHREDRDTAKDEKILLHDFKIKKRIL
jgi:formate/nitrite transporter FocA (FNT family)